MDLEERFGSLALDIIGRAVFNYDFDRYFVMKEHMYTQYLALHSLGASEKYLRFGILVAVGVEVNVRNAIQLF